MIDLNLEYGQISVVKSSQSFFFLLESIQINTVFFSQAMQNSSIESRTGLRLEREIQAMQQKLEDFKFKKQQERSTLGL